MKSEIAVKIRLILLWILYVLANIVRYKLGTLNKLSIVTGTISGILLLYFVVFYHNEK